MMQLPPTMLSMPSPNPHASKALLRPHSRHPAVANYAVLVPTVSQPHAQVADALADIQYVLSGAVHEFGMGACFAALFAEVQRSNMSKACASMSEAEATVAHYVAKGQPARFEEVEGKFLVYRSEDSKVLKSVEYSPAALAPILDLRKEGSENVPLPN